MTGVVKSVGKYALLAGTALGLSISAAQAASMTDAGLEKRVSDLEREVALLKNRLKTAKSCDCDRIVRSGNSRVKVTLYGQVNRAVRFSFASSDTQVSHVDQDGSSSRLGFLARGRIDPDLTISARIEVEWQNQRRSFHSDNSLGSTRVRSRLVEVWLDHKDLGQLWLGHGGNAADAANLFSISGTSFIFAFHGPGGTPGAGDDGILAPQGGNAMTAGRGFFSAFTGYRENRIMYVTPNIAGFRVRVSHGEGDTFAVGVRYAGNPFGVKDFRAIMAAGYMYGPGRKAAGNAPALGLAPTVGIVGGAPAVVAGAAPGTRARNNSNYGISGGLLHVPTGLNISGAWGLTAGHNAGKGAHGNPHMWAFEAGWRGKIWAMGATAIAAGFGNWYNTPGPQHAFGYRFHAAAVQTIDAAATDIYLGVSYDDGHSGGAAREGMVTVITGVRIKF